MEENKTEGENLKLSTFHYLHEKRDKYRGGKFLRHNKKKKKSS